MKPVAVCGLHNDVICFFYDGWVSQYRTVHDAKVSGEYYLRYVVALGYPKLGYGGTQNMSGIVKYDFHLVV